MMSMSLPAQRFVRQGDYGAKPTEPPAYGPQALPATPPPPPPPPPQPKCGKLYIAGIILGN